MARFGIGFAAILLILYALQLSPPGQEWFVAPWTATVAAASVSAARFFDAAVYASGPTLFDSRSGHAMTILAGCNGVEATLALVAAMLAFPAPWTLRLWGMAAGTAAIQALNIVRIVSLFYLGQWNRDVFQWAHLYAWQTLIMLDALIVWILWTRSVSRAVPTAVRQAS